MEHKSNLKGYRNGTTTHEFSRPEMERSSTSKPTTQRATDGCLHPNLLLHFRPSGVSNKLWQGRLGVNAIVEEWLRMKRFEREWLMMKRFEREWLRMKRFEREWLRVKRFERKWLRMKRLERNWLRMKRFERK